MKKIFLLLIFILSLVGCDNNVYYWEFNYSYEEVVQIKIIEMIDDLDYREIQEIDLSLSEQIYNDIMNIEMDFCRLIQGGLCYEQNRFIYVELSSYI